MMFQMDFIMPASAIVKIIYRIALLVLFAMPVMAESFRVQSATINKIGNGFVVNAEMHYPLSARVIEALENSVPITFSQQLELIKSVPLLGKYWQWKETFWTTELRYELRYHALTQQYVLHSIDTLHHQNFPTLESALNALGRIKNLSLPPEYLIDRENLILNLRTELDLHALPTPMRPGALISSKWQLTSPWVAATWP
jgi:uncharacterized protein DUF4390